MNETMNWDDYRLFVAVADHAGLAGAAQVTGTSRATLGRRMLALERHLGQVLFDRHARGYALTADGRALRARLQGVARQFEELAQGDRPVPVTISAGTWVSMALAPHVRSLLAPDIRLRLISSEAKSDIARRAALIGVRNARPTELGLAARRVQEVTFAGYARAGAPAAWIGIASETPSARWVQEQGTSLIEVSAPRVALDLAQDGVGQVVLPMFIGRASGLKQVTDVIPALTHDQWLVSHETDRHIPQVRGVLTRLASVLAGL